MLQASSMVLLMCISQPAPPVSRKLCVYDPSGANGDAFRLAKDYRDAALAWGVQFSLKPYTDERTAAEDFQAGACDASLLTGVRARQFNRFGGTIEALGSLPSYDSLQKVLGHLGAKAAGPLMRSGDNETVAVFPAGAVYLFVRQRSVRSMGDLAGKRVATIDNDDAARAMVSQAGASAVTADIGAFAPMFNNGAVDACYAPAMAYEPLELRRGITPDGGVVRYPLAQLTFQVVAHQSSLPQGFAAASRTFSVTQAARLVNMAQKAEAKIPKDRWIDIPEAERAGYEAMFQRVRLALRDDGVYDKNMLTLLRRVRCKEAADRAECANVRE